MNATIPISFLDSLTNTASGAASGASWQRFYHQFHLGADAAAERALRGTIDEALQAVISELLVHTANISSVPVTEHPSQSAVLEAKLQYLQQLKEDWDTYGAAPPNSVAMSDARSILERSFSLGVWPSDVLPSAEGGVYVAFDSTPNRRANIECLNDGTVYAATLTDKVAVWPVSVMDQADLDATLQRIAEHLAD